jgi:ribosomal protein L37AE/L43A
MAKPSKCPQCGDIHFFIVDEKSSGKIIWQCSKCGRQIAD